MKVVKNGPQAEEAGLGDKDDVLSEDKQEESRPLARGGAITGMREFSLKHGKAETSVNR